MHFVVACAICKLITQHKKVEMMHYELTVNTLCIEVETKKCFEVERMLLELITQQAQY